MNDIHLDDNETPSVNIVLEREDGTTLEVYFTGEVTVYDKTGREVRTVDLLTL